MLCVSRNFLQYFDFWRTQFIKYRNRYAMIFICQRKRKASIPSIHPFIHQMCTVRRTDELHPWYGNFTGQFMASFRQIESFVYYVKYVSPFSTHFLQLHLCNSCAPSASRTPTGLATSRPDFNCGRLSTWSVVCGCVWRLIWHWAKLRHSIVLNLGIMYLYLDHYLLSYYYFID